jgi:hypothetical protein
MIDDVKAARAGDPNAFSRLVERFQDMAVAFALGWVGDAAEDVVQEAFIEAFLKLHQLREPAAFPGCDNGETALWIAVTPARRQRSARSTLASLGRFAMPRRTAC